MNPDIRSVAGPLPRQIFVAPPFDGPLTGGTCYNAALVWELRRLGVDCVRLDADAALDRLEAGDAGVYWVDSLYLDRLPRLARAGGGSARVRLVAHYLPSLVDHGAVASAADLSPEERAALTEASGVLAPSRWLVGVLSDVGVASDRVVVVEPGVDPAGPECAAGPAPDATPEGSRFEPRQSRVRALLVANLLPGKGVLPLLDALERSPVPGLELVLIGDDLDRTYSGACRDRVAASPVLREGVAFAGPLPYTEILRRLRSADVFVSASRMETYGMALAAARAEGVPIVARAAGNVGFHVDAAAGGVLLADDAGIVRELAALCLDRPELERRKAQARTRLLRRTWADAAREFVARVGGLP